MEEFQLCWLLFYTKKNEQRVAKPTNVTIVHRTIDSVYVHTDLEKNIFYYSNIIQGIKDYFQTSHHFVTQFYH